MSGVKIEAGQVWEWDVTDDCDFTSPSCAGTALDVASWLLDNGYRHVEIAGAKPLSSETASSEGPRTWDRAASRNAIDAAVARLRGQPFAKAIQAVLVGAAEFCGPTQQQIDGVIAACRTWEATRSRVAHGQRSLRLDQRLACNASAIDAAVSAGSFWLSPAGDIYERARAAL